MWVLLSHGCVPTDAPGTPAHARRAHGTAEPPQATRPAGPDLTVADFAVKTARLASFFPSKRQPMPGEHKFREGQPILSLFVGDCRAMREYVNLESTVLN